jgi:hypothetical protein
MKKLFKFTFFIIVVLFIGNTSFAQEKEKFEAKCTGVFTKYHRIEVNDPSEHTFSLYEAKGAGLSALGHKFGDVFLSCHFLLVIEFV